MPRRIQMLRPCVAAAVNVTLIGGAGLSARSAAAQPIRAQGRPAPIVAGSTLTFTGTADATDIGLGGVVLDFHPNAVDVATTGNTGSFTSLNRANGAGLSGHIADLRVGNGPQVDRNFLVLGGYRFTLAELPVGGYGQDVCYTAAYAVGQRCTPFQSVQGDPTVNVGLSPFYVENVAPTVPGTDVNSIASFNLLGTVTGPGGETSDFFGTISATFIGVPYQYVLYTLEQQGLTGVQFTGTFTAGTPTTTRSLASATVGTAAVVPEPGTMVLTVAGLAAVGFAARRRRDA